MSIPLSFDKITQKTKDKLISDLKVEIIQNPKYYKGEKKYVYPYNVVNKTIYLPFHYSIAELELKPKPKLNRVKSEIIYNIEYPLREEQRKVKSEALEQLNLTGCCILSLYTGFGKTCLSLYLAAKLGMKTLYINNRLTIINQLIDSIKKFTNAKVQLLFPGCKKEEDVDFYVINAINVPKFDYDFYKDISTLIIDECHCIMAEVLSKSLMYIEPRYLIGLSATPYRTDGMDKLLDLYFGENRIVRKLFKSHKVYKIETGIKLKFEYSKFGKINWNSLLNSQAENKERNESIINLVKSIKDRIILILCKRVNQVKYLHKRLKEEGENVESLHGNKTEYDSDCRILVGTNGKVGVGFDNIRLNTLILAADVEEYYIQIMGRVFRTPDTEPIIYDIVDDNPILIKHWFTRENVYKDHGGVINKYVNETPITF